MKFSTLAVDRTHPDNRKNGLFGAGPTSLRPGSPAATPVPPSATTQSATEIEPSDQHPLKQKENKMLLKGENKLQYTVTLDDDPIVCKIVEGATDFKSFNFCSASDLLKELNLFEPLALFIDVHLTNHESGIDVIPNVKKEWPEAPIIVITSDPSSELVGQALAAGADDFLRKPIDPIELRARLKARMAQITEKKGSSILYFGDLKLDLTQKSLVGKKGTRCLSSREAALLAYLIQTGGAIADKDILKRRLWGHIVVSNNALDRKIFEVRRAIREVSDEVEIYSSYGEGLGLRMLSHADQDLLLSDFEIQRAKKQALS